MATEKIIGSASALNTGAVYQTGLSASRFHLVADEPVAYGGAAAGPSPVDYLCMALASCKVITIRMYVQRKGWKLDQVSVQVAMVKSEGMPSGQQRFVCDVLLTGELNAAQQQRILQIAKVCPIERLLGKPNEVVTTIRCTTSPD